MTASLQPSKSKNPKWFIVLSYKNQRGQWRQKWIGTGLLVKANTKRKAESMIKPALEKWQERLEAPNFEDILFSDWLLKWLEETKTNIAESTYTNYKMQIKGAICPYFQEKGIKLADLKAYHIQDFYALKLESGLSANTIKHYHAYIHKALQYAVKTERIPANPSDRVELPKKKRHIANVLTPDELKVLLNGAANTEIEPVVWLAVYLGLRREEIIGLKWEFVNFQKQTVTICGAMVKNGNQMVYTDTTKTNASVRVLKMPDDLSAFLYGLFEKQQALKSGMGKSGAGKFDFVCSKPNGEVIPLDYATRQLPKLCEQCGLKRIKLHELRHSNISLLVNENPNLKLIQQWAGHSNITTTADIYGHAYSDKLIELSAAVDKALAK